MLYFIHISLQNEDLGSRYFQGLLFFISILCHFTKTLSILRLRLATDLSFCSFCYPTICRYSKKLFLPRQTERRMLSSQPHQLTSLLAEGSAAKTVYQNRLNSTRFAMK